MEKNVHWTPGVLDGADLSGSEAGQRREGPRSGESLLD